MQRTMRKSAPLSSAESEVSTVRATVSKLLAWLLSGCQAGRVAESVIAQPCEAANRPNVRNPRSGMPRKGTLGQTSAQPDFGGRIVNMTKTDGRYGAGEEKQVPHRQHATLPSTLCDAATPRRLYALGRKCVTFASKHQKCMELQLSA